MASSELNLLAVPGESNFSGLKADLSSHLAVEEACIFFQMKSPILYIYIWYCVYDIIVWYCNYNYNYDYPTIPTWLSSRPLLQSVFVQVFKASGKKSGGSCWTPPSWPVHQELWICRAVVPISRWSPSTRSSATPPDLEPCWWDMMLHHFCSKKMPILQDRIWAYWFDIPHIFIDIPGCFQKQFQVLDTWVISCVSWTSWTLRKALQCNQVALYLLSLHGPVSLCPSHPCPSDWNVARHTSKGFCLCQPRWAHEIGEDGLSNRTESSHVWISEKSIL